MLTDAVRAAVDALDGTEDADQGAIELAAAYAAAIDAQTCGECGEHRSLDVLGPKLLAALEALGASPRARAAVKGGGRDSSTPSPLDELRERRRARERDTAAVDAAAT